MSREEWAEEQARGGMGRREAKKRARGLMIEAREEDVAARS